MSRFRRWGLRATILAAIVASSGCRFTGWYDNASKAVAADAVDWLLTQQQPDGGFEVAGFPGFETPDAILAIGEDAQQQSNWSKVQARNAVLATTENGFSPLHAIDDLVDDPGLSAGQAAKVVVLVANPLGIGAGTFDPDGDGARNLKTVINNGAAPDGTYGTFSATLYAAIALRALNGSVPAVTRTAIRNAQGSDGGWNFAGDPGLASDIDTTGLAVQALVAANVGAADPDVRAGLKFLAEQQESSGAWQSFGSDDPNSTSVAVLAITAAGYNPAAACWRDVVAPGMQGDPYASPIVWLRSQQAGDGHITSPNDPFGVNTFATSQTVQALRRGSSPLFVTNGEPCP
jgi:hypothetical protein